MLKRKITLKDKKIIRRVLHERELHKKIEERELYRQIQQRWNDYKFPPTGNDVDDFELVVHNVLNELFPNE